MSTVVVLSINSKTQFSSIEHGDIGRPCRIYKARSRDTKTPSRKGACCAYGYLHNLLFIHYAPLSTRYSDTAVSLPLDSPSEIPTVPFRPLSPLPGKHACSGTQNHFASISNESVQRGDWPVSSHFFGAWRQEEETALLSTRGLHQPS